MDDGAEARRRLEASGGPVLLTGWRDVLFHHLAIDPATLQPHVPFELDLHDGQAYVSIVLFSQDRLRLAAGGMARRLIPGAGAARLCNLRTYVRAGDEGAVYFLREWISDPLASAVAPCVYGLPTVPAQIRYENDVTAGILFGQVAAGADRLDVSARLDYAAAEEGAPADSLTHFLLERYRAVTDRGRPRAFRIWHPSWRVQRVTAEIGDDALLRRVAPWYDLAAAPFTQFTRGMATVLIGRPRLLTPLRSAARVSGLSR
ncbi:MAG TPA: DUF2071 domain-containing protein [Chloroflexota bacterium]|nr:DUF2071 domain-containing protein [Chloroflexota bacterium]